LIAQKAIRLVDVISILKQQLILYVISLEMLYIPPSKKKYWARTLPLGTLYGLFIERSSPLSTQKNIEVYI
jgi:hypothetical protein